MENATGSFLGLDSWGVSISGWGSGLVGIECANAQNSYRELLGVSGDESQGVLYESWGVITPAEGGVENSLKCQMPYFGVCKHRNPWVVFQKALRG